MTVGLTDVPIMACPRLKEGTKARPREDLTQVQLSDIENEKTKPSSAVGVNLSQFGPLLQKLATEVSIVKDKASNDREKRLFIHYTEILLSYNDSNQLWQSKIKNARYDWIPEGEILIDNELHPLIEKYELKSRRFRPDIR